MLRMTAPYAAEFRRLVRLGAGARDIHGTAEVGFARRTAASDAFVAREEARVETHRRGSCALLEAFAGPAARVLDVGCSTGGSTVAFALSPVLAPELIIGVDPDALSLRAAEVRARGYGLDRRRIVFVRNEPGAPLPFASESFDLVVGVSVLEFVPTPADRRHLIDEMKRLVRPGGHVFVATPNPLRLRDLHAKRWLGDVLRRDGYPWASPPWTMQQMLDDFDRVDTDRWTLGRALALPERFLPPPIPGVLRWAHPWQKFLVRKPDAPASS
jgi:SAM-dependent methyltransferase